MKNAWTFAIRLYGKVLADSAENASMFASKLISDGHPVEVEVLQRNIDIEVIRGNPECICGQCICGYHNPKN